MKKIFIYAENEDMASLKPLANRLVSKGAQVLFSALKYREANPKAELVLTLEKNKNTVTKMFADNGLGHIPIQTIEDVEGSDLAKPPILTEAATPVLVIPVVDEPMEAPPEPEIELPPVAETEEVVVITVGETAATPTRRASRRTPKED